MFIFTVYFTSGVGMSAMKHSAAYKLNQQINGKGGKVEKIETIAK